MPPQFQVVKSVGMFHGLPTFPEKAGYQDLTAIVTGANGRSTVVSIRMRPPLTSFQAYPGITWLRF